MDWAHKPSVMAFYRGPVSRNSAGLHETIGIVLPQRELWMLQLNFADTMRQEKAPIVTGKHRARTGKAQLGQFMTPASVARFMASLFPAGSLHTCRLLDAGAGRGALTCAFLQPLADGRLWL